MKNDMKKKIAILIIGIIFAVAIGGSLIWILTKQEGGGTDGSKTDVTEDKPGDKSGDSEDPGKDKDDASDLAGGSKYISDCDSFDNLEEHRSVLLVTEEGKYVQGTGAFCNAETTSVFASVKLKEAVDVSAFKAGYLHLSYYVSSKKYFAQNLYFEISSAGTCDQEELAWEIALDTVQEGWNEVYMSVPEAVTTGRIDLSRVNYFRFYSPSINRGTDSLDVIVDDIYMTKSTGGAATIGGISSSAGGDTEIVRDSYEETQAKDGIMIASCNTMNIFDRVKNLEVTTQKGQYIEGSGAMKIVNGSSASFMLKNPVDISKYMTQEGKLCVSLYVSDASLLTGAVNFFLSNVEDREDAMMYWSVNKTEFQTGWNEVKLDFYASWMHRPIKAEEVKYFSFTTGKPSGDMTLILDNIHVSDH